MRKAFSRLLLPRIRRTTMEITSDNFKERLPQIEEAIDTATFISFDGEFTGLNAYRGISPLDLPHERYDKLQESSRQFLLIQFGLCTFHYEPKEDRFTHQAFNVFVWPRPCSRSAPDPRFLCQTSSIDFLISQNFDFNKLFKHGVSYMRPAEVEKMKATLLERQENRRNSQIVNTPQQKIDVPPEQEEFLARVMTNIEDFLKSEEQQLELESKMNSYQRRLVYQTAKERFTNISLTSVTRSGTGDRVIMVVKADEEQQLYLEHVKEQAELSELQDAFGFSRVIQKITESGKLVVGHNMVLDVAHTLNQFVGPLPESYTEFKVMTSSVFPRLLDTKLMANITPFKQEILNSSLEEMYKTVCSSPYQMPPCTSRESESGYEMGQEKYHEAGYDAYITGLCFIAMMNRLGKLCGQGDKDKAGRVLPDSPLVQPFLNKLYLMRIPDIPYMNLTGEDVVPDRNHVFHISFPKEWKTNDLVHLFSEFGYVTISWIDDTSAFVSLKEKDLAVGVLKSLPSSSLYQIQSYQRYRESQSEELSSPPLETGVTPSLEKHKPFSNGSSTEPVKKRSLSPEGNTLKRLKSVTEEETVVKNDKKTFEEPEWE